MNQPLLITSERHLARALTQVMAEVFGIKLSVLPVDGMIVQPFGDAWFKTPQRYVAAGDELRRRWASGEISHAVVGPLGVTVRARGPRLFIAFLRRFYRCPVPIIGLETDDGAAGPSLPDATYMRVPLTSVALLAESLARTAPAPTQDVGREFAGLVGGRLWRVLTHDFGKMENKARGARKAHDPIRREAASRSLLSLYRELQLATSFLRTEPESRHLLPEQALRGLESACEAAIEGGLPLDQSWVPRIKAYVDDCVTVVENWR